MEIADLGSSSEEPVWVLTFFGPRAVFSLNVSHLALQLMLITLRAVSDVVVTTALPGY